MSPICNPVEVDVGEAYMPPPFPSSIILSFLPSSDFFESPSPSKSLQYQIEKTNESYNIRIVSYIWNQYFFLKPSEFENIASESLAWKKFLKSQAGPST